MFNVDSQFKKTETETVQKQIEKLSIELDLITHKPMKGNGLNEQE